MCNWKTMVRKIMIFRAYIIKNMINIVIKEHFTNLWFLCLGPPFSAECIEQANLDNEDTCNKCGDNQKTIYKTLFVFAIVNEHCDMLLYLKENGCLSYCPQCVFDTLSTWMNCKVLDWHGKWKLYGKCTESGKSLPFQIQIQIWDFFKG